MSTVNNGRRTHVNTFHFGSDIYSCPHNPTGYEPCSICNGRSDRLQSSPPIVQDNPEDEAFQGFGPRPAERFQTSGIQELKTRDIVDIVVENVEKVLSSSSHKLDKKAKFKEYLESLKESNEFNIQSQVAMTSTYNPNLVKSCKVWCLAALSTLLGIRFLVCTLQLEVEMYQIAWKLNPGDLYSLVLGAGTWDDIYAALPE